VPTLKARTDVGLRDALADVMRGGLDVAERFERLGAAGSGDAIRRVLDQLDAGAPVTVASWELTAALDGVNAPASEVRAIATGRPDYFVVSTDGDYEPAR
jgi:hypothetical protein